MAIKDFLNRQARKLPSWPVYIMGVLPGFVYFYWAVMNQLGPDPLAALEHQLGIWALQLLIVTLAVTPLRNITGLSLLKFRRALGLLAFFYICAHFLTWLVLDKQFFWGEILADLTKRPYIILGMTAFMVLVPLAATSNDGSVRRLGAAAWRRLHRLSYAAVLFAAGHYLLVVKAWPIEPIAYAVIALALVLMRVPVGRLVPNLRPRLDSPR